MKKAALVTLILMLLLACGATPVEEKNLNEQKEELPQERKIYCEKEYELAYYHYDAEYDEHEVITRIFETHYWNNKGWSYNKKNYAKKLKKEAKALNKIAGVVATYEFGEGKQYTTTLEISVAEFDQKAFFKKASFYASYHLQEYFGEISEERPLKNQKQDFLDSFIYSNCDCK